MEETRQTSFPGLRLEHSCHSLPEVELPALLDHLLIVDLTCSTEVTRFREGGKDRHDFRPGEMSLVPAGQSGRLLFGGEINALHLYIPQNLVAKVAEMGDVADRSRELTDHFILDDPQLLHVCLALDAEEQDRGRGGRLYAESLTTALVSYLLTRCSAFPPVVFHAGSGGLSPSQLRRTLDHVHDSLNHDLSLAELAATAGLGVSRFKVLFKQSTGRTPHQYVIEQRVKRAQYLLRHGKMTIGQIASEVGFYDQSHLSRHFKQIVGVPPKSFLRRK